MRSNPTDEKPNKWAIVEIGWNETGVNCLSTNKVKQPS